MPSRKTKKRTVARSRALAPSRARVEAKAPARAPEIFIASASEDRSVVLEVAAWVQRAGAIPRPWEAEFPIGWSTLPRLIELSHQVDGSIIIAHGLDPATVRGEAKSLPRDNVLLELGIFMSALSQSRTALLVNLTERPAPDMPSDLGGLIYLPYRRPGDAVAREALEKWIHNEFFLQPTNGRALTVRNGKVYTWDDVVRGVNYIQLRLEQDGFVPDCVLALGRSGGVIGGLLASFIGSIPMAFADLKYAKTGRGKGGIAYEVTVKADAAELPTLGKAQRVLVVEGATTTGETPKQSSALLRKRFPKVDFRFAVLIQCAASRFHCDYYAYLERGTLVSPSGHSLLPWHGPASRTFLAPAVGQL